MIRRMRRYSEAAVLTDLSKPRESAVRLAGC